MLSESGALQALLRHQPQRPLPIWELPSQPELGVLSEAGLFVKASPLLEPSCPPPLLPQCYIMIQKGFLPSGSLPPTTEQRQEAQVAEGGLTQRGWGKTNSAEGLEWGGAWGRSCACGGGAERPLPEAYSVLSSSMSPGLPSGTHRAHLHICSQSWWEERGVWSIEQVTAMYGPQTGCLETSIIPHCFLNKVQGP